MVERLVLSIKWTDNIENLVNRILRIILALKPMNKQDVFLDFISKSSVYNPYAVYEAVHQAYISHSITEELLIRSKTIINELVKNTTDNQIDDIYWDIMYSLTTKDKNLYFIKDKNLGISCTDLANMVIGKLYKDKFEILVTFLLYNIDVFTHENYINILSNKELNLHCKADGVNEEIRQLFMLLFDKKFYVACRYLEKKMPKELFINQVFFTKSAIKDILINEEKDTFAFYSICMLVRNIYRIQKGENDACEEWFDLVSSVYEMIPDWVYFIYWTDCINSTKHIIPDSVIEMRELENVSVIPSKKIVKVLDITISNILKYGNERSLLFLQKLGKYNRYNNINIFQKRYYGREQINNRQIVRTLIENGCSISNIVEIYFRSYWKTECFIADVLDVIPKVKYGYTFGNANNYLLTGCFGVSRDGDCGDRHLYFDGLYDVYKGRDQIKYIIKSPEEKGNMVLALHKNQCKFSFYFHGYNANSKTIYLDYKYCEKESDFSYETLVGYLHGSNIRALTNLLYKQKSSYFIKAPQILYLHEKLMKSVIRAIKNNSDVSEYLVVNLIYEFNRVTSNEYGFSIDKELPKYDFYGKIKEQTETTFNQIMRVCSKKISVWFYFNTSLKCIIPFNKFMNKLNYGGPISLNKMRLLDKPIFPVQIYKDTYKLTTLRLSPKIELKIGNAIYKYDNSITDTKTIYIKLVSLYGTCLTGWKVNKDDYLTSQPNYTFNKTLYKFYEKNISESDWAILSNMHVSCDRIRIIPYLRVMYGTYMHNSVEEYINKLTKLEKNNLYRDGMCYEVSFGRPFTETEKINAKERYISQYKENDKVYMDFLYKNSFLKMIISEEEYNAIRKQEGIYG